jgi:hypothetical protein
MGFLETRVDEIRRAAGAERGETEMPLETKDKNDPKRRLVKVRFLRNTCDDGVDYGPDYPKKVATVPFNRAQAYISSGRAEAAGDDDELKEVEEAARAAGNLPDDRKRK